jgi:nitrogen fixation protein FixH
LTKADTDRGEDAMTSNIQPDRQPSLWRLYPYAVAAFLGVVMVVNFGMAWTALRTFPGVATHDVFDHSNNYDQVLAAAAREAALGWSMHAELDQGRPVVVLAGPDGRPLTNARLEGRAHRALGADDTVELAFQAIAPGRFIAVAALDEPGQWDLQLVASQDGHMLHATRRLVVR